MLQIIQEKDLFKIYRGAEFWGEVEIFFNRYHRHNCYLKLSLKEWDKRYAGTLFDRIQACVKMPLQIMCDSHEREQIVFIEHGGFLRMRRCFCSALPKTALKQGKVPSFLLSLAEKGEARYESAADLMFRQYCETHAAINGFTGDFSDFCEILPQRAYCYGRGEKVEHFAFVEDNELAYVGTVDWSNFRPFLHNVVKELFSVYDKLEFESDDVDPYGMAILDLFEVSPGESHDTFVRKMR